MPDSVLGVYLCVYVIITFLGQVVTSKLLQWEELKNHADHVPSCALSPAAGGPEKGR